MKKLLIVSMILLLGAGMYSCTVDFAPTDKMSSAQIEADPGGALYLTNGCYSMLKDNLSFPYGGSTGNTYVRHYYQMSEFRGDNFVITGRSSDPFYEVATFTDHDNLFNLSYFWWISYRIIYTANIVIESVDDGASAESDHLKGECYFLRALCHFNLVNLYAKNYVHGRDNPGVIIRTSSFSDKTTRATVGEVYDQIMDDLDRAIELMDGGSRRGHAGYVSKETAQALKVRSYLYMNENQKVVDLVNQMLAGAAPASKLHPQIGDYYANALNSVETLWAIAHTSKDNKVRSSLSSMYYNGGTGWGEIYLSDPAVKLFNRYPDDERWTDIHLYDKMPGDTMMVRWVAEPDGSNFFRNAETRDLELGKDAQGRHYFIQAGQTIPVETEIVNTYPQNYIMYNGQKKEAIVSVKSTVRNSFPKIFNLKYSYQDGEPTLSSPVVLRWGEMILNRAEAYAKLGQDANAIADVNVLRARAGLGSDAMFTTSNYQARGYASVLDVVLDERRLELCWEGQRAFDLVRNKKVIDRRYASMQAWETLEYTDNRIPLRIPFIETSVSGIAQNP